ncbi:NAD-dependent epimerase/dehydratase family protein [Candidatus Poribacteria bacterium]|nr:NAD-dependent epimerase/dehydratase family protein [Candidatus Poribacteria bacterium]
MKLLVTGGAGFIGSNLVDHFIARGHEVAVIDSLVQGKRSNVNPDADFHELDITDPRVEDVVRGAAPEVIFHYAAQIDVRRSVADPITDATWNILGTLRVLEAARAVGVRKIIFASTGGVIYGTPDYLPADEAHPRRPEVPYGVTKRCVELYLPIYRALHGVDFTVLRYANVFGPRQDPAGEAGVIAIFTDLMLRGRIPRIFGTGKQTRDFVFVGDVIRANEMVLNAGGGEIFNVGTGVPRSVLEVFAALKSALDFPHDAEFAPARPGELDHIYLDCAKIRAELEWEPQVGFEEAVQRTVDWFRR